MKINNEFFSAKEFKKLDFEYVKKLIWAMCWSDEHLTFDMDRCVELLRNLDLINENRIVFKKDEA